MVVDTENYVALGPVPNKVRGLWQFAVSSPYQTGINTIEAVLPAGYDEKQAYPVVYLLPVESGVGGKFGDPIDIVRTQELDRKHDVLFVVPTFATWPWYMDNPKDSDVRLESYMLKVVVPLIERTWSTRKGREGRILLGFSKSGYGAFTLILRNPEFFGYAASWDAPLMMRPSDFDIWNTGEQHGTQENFERCLPTRLACEQARHFRDRKRLVLMGHQSFGARECTDKGKPHTATYHALLDQLAVPHVYRNDLRVPHNWNWRWMGPALEAVLELAEKRE